MQVPTACRGPWLDRRRWLAGGHRFTLSPSSLSSCDRQYASAFQHALHCLSPIAHGLSLLSAPVMASMPFMCAVLRLCPYGMDPLLLWTHLAHLGTAGLVLVYHPNPARVWRAFGAHITARNLWLTAALASVHTVVVRAGLARAGCGRCQRHGQLEVDPQEVVVSGDVRGSCAEAGDDACEPEREGGRGEAERGAAPV